MIETTELSPLGEDFLQTFTVTSPERDSQSPVSTNYSGGGGDCDFCFSSFRSGNKWDLDRRETGRGNFSGEGEESGRR